SRSLAGVSVVRISFAPDADPRAALATVNTLALACVPNLPPGTPPPVVLPFDPAAPPLAAVTVDDPTRPVAELTDLARARVLRALGGVPGVLAPLVLGGADRAVLVHLDPARLEARKLSPLDVAAALRGAGLPPAPGAGLLGDNRLSLDATVARAK